MPNDVYWASTPRELAALLEALDERRTAEAREAALRAGLIASAIYNASPNRKKNARWLRPQDFVRQEPRHMTPQELKRRLDLWAAAINASHK